MVFIQDVRRAQAFVAVMFKRENMSKDVLDDVIKRCRLAVLLDKPMYLVIEDGENQGILGDVSWSKVIKFTDKNSLPNIMQYIIHFF